MRDNVIPMLVARQAEAFAPLLSHTQCPAPIRQLKRGVLAGRLIVDLLSDPEGWPEFVDAFFRIEMDHRGQALRGLKYEVTILRKGRRRRLIAVKQFAEVNQMRLIPYNQR